MFRIALYNIYLCCSATPHGIGAATTAIQYAVVAIAASTHFNCTAFCT